MAPENQVPGQVYHLPPTENRNNNSDDNDESGDSSTNTSPTSTDSENQENFSSETPSSSPPHFKARMLNLCKELAIVVLVAAAYAAVSNEQPPKISKSPAAYPFFPRGSIVSDWYKGQVTKAIELARTSDIAFVMFYAPWDAESQAARREFESAARFMRKIVSFAAVNCWQPGGECRKQYSKVYKWPVLIAYPTHGRGVQYNGPLKAAHMIKFLQNVCTPLVMPQNINDLISKHDAVVLGTLNLLPGSLEYAVFYSAALKFLEKDPFKDVSFAVLPQNGRNPPRISLYIWNETIVYDGEWNSEALLGWVLKNSYQIAGWISPTGSKSLSLSNTIQPGPSLILFTPRNPFFDDNDVYNLLKELAYEYSNCNGSNVISLKRKLIQMRRLRNRLEYRDLRKRCTQKASVLTSRGKIVKVSKNWANVTAEQSCDNSCEFDGEEVCLSTGRFRTSMLGGSSFPSNEDLRSPKFLEKLWKEEECRNYFLAEKYHAPIFVDNEENDGFNISGIGCTTNRSLAFIAMDSIQYYHFAEKLGLNLFEIKDMTGALILNDELETHHILHGPVTGSKLGNFISKFTRGILPRALHPNPQLNSKNTHIYPQISCGKCEKGQFCIPELDSHTFLPTVLQPNKAVLVFYYSRQCAFCKGVAFKFLTVAKMLSNVTDLLLARIDGDLNLLTWEYTIEIYPTILLFPPNKKSESRAFPRSLPVTVPNLIGFILSNLNEPGIKIQTMWTICNVSTFEGERADCVSSIRVEILSIIDSCLKLWRIVDSRQKLEVLGKLQILRHLHLLFIQPSTFAKNVEILQNLNKLKVFDVINRT